MVERRVANGGAPAWSSDGVMLAFVCGSRIEVVAVDEPRPRADPRCGEASAEAPAWSPSGNRIAYIACGRQGCKLVVAEVTDRTLRRIATVRGDEDPAWSANGHTIVFVRKRTETEPQGLCLFDLPPGHVRRLLARGR